MVYELAKSTGSHSKEAAAELGLLISVYQERETPMNKNDIGQWQMKTVLTTKVHLRCLW